MRGARCSRIIVRNILQASGTSLATQLGQGGGFGLAAAKVAVNMLYNIIIPRAYANTVGVLKVDGAIRAELQDRMRIVHNRTVAVPAGGEIMGKAEGVADFVGCELAQACQRHLFGELTALGGSRSAIRRQQGF